MNKTEKEILEKIYDYTRLFKPLNPADVNGVVQHSKYAHYAMEYLGEIIEGMIRGKDVSEQLEFLKENYEEFKEACMVGLRK